MTENTLTNTLELGNHSLVHDHI